MEVASSILPIIMYTLLSILIVFIIVLVYKLIGTVDKANNVLDDVETKVHKLDNLFEVNKNCVSFIVFVSFYVIMEGINDQKIKDDLQESIELVTPTILALINDLIFRRDYDERQKRNK